MSRFVKLFDTRQHGQILVLQETDGNGDPAIKFKAKPKGMGVCSVVASFPDTGAGRAACDSAFDSIGEDEAKRAVIDMFSLSEDLACDLHAAASPELEEEVSEALADFKSFMDGYPVHQVTEDAED